MNPPASPFPHDHSYTEQCIGAARHDAANAQLIAHLRTCPACVESLFGFCDVALRIVGNPPDIQPVNN